MGLLLSTRRALLGSVAAWTPASPTIGGYSPDHWYRSDSGLWQDAGTTPAAADGDVVGRWEDLTANADHVNQAGVAFKPTLQNGAGDLLNGHPVVRFDGTDDFLQGAFTTGGAMAQPNTVFVVCMLDNPNDDVYRVIIDDDSVLSMMLGQRNADVPDKWFMYGGAVLQGGASDGNWNTWTALFNGAASQVWLNGISSIGPGNPGALAVDGLTIGCNKSGVNPWEGDATEIIIYDANLSNADKNQVGQYAATRYALAYTDI